MDHDPSRREFLGLLGAGLLGPYAARFVDFQSPGTFRIRTITAGISLADLADLAKIESAIRFLHQARQDFVAAGYEVQTIRIATQPIAAYRAASLRSTLDAVQTFDGMAQEHGLMFSIGPLGTSDGDDADLASWAAQIIGATSNISCSLSVAAPGQGVHPKSVRTAAEAIAAIARAAPGGEGNFRFAATALCPPGTPFFPAAYHQGRDAFSIGLESPGLLQPTLDEGPMWQEARPRLEALLNAALGPVENLARGIGDRTGRRYLGIDVSPAPGLDASIGRVIETLTGAAFGDPSTLAACALITDVLQRLRVQRCGYSGLMLPVLEDPVLARRAAEGRYGIQELLLYSSVCGTGLDVVPLPGDASPASLASLITDVAALATKLAKPLSARLFPIPGKRAGEAVHFENPFLTDSVVMSLG